MSQRTEFERTRVSKKKNSTPCFELSQTRWKLQLSLSALIPRRKLMGRFDLLLVFYFDINLFLVH